MTQLFLRCCFAKPLRSGKHGRWLLAREALLAQGFPVYTALSSGIPLCSFANSVRPTTGRTAQIGQAGNAMHAECCGIALGFALTQVKFTNSAFQSPAMSALASSLLANYA